MGESRSLVAAEDIVDAKHVGEKQTVEQASFEYLGEIDPIVEALVIPRAVTRVPPQTRRLVRDAIHLEGVEADFPRHRFIRQRLSPGRR